MEKKQNRSALSAVLSIFARSNAKRKETYPAGQRGEHLAAIAFALYQYSKDTAKPAPAMNRAARANSAWGSKIHGLRQIPNKKGRNERL